MDRNPQRDGDELEVEREALSLYIKNVQAELLSARNLPRGDDPGQPRQRNTMTGFQLECLLRGSVLDGQSASAFSGTRILWPTELISPLKMFQS
jgi:hypothetical protein